MVTTIRPHGHGDRTPDRRPHFSTNLFHPCPVICRNPDISSWTYTPGHILPWHFPSRRIPLSFLHGVGHFPLPPPPSADLQYKALLIEEDRLGLGVWVSASFKFSLKQPGKCRLKWGRKLSGRWNYQGAYVRGRKCPTGNVLHWICQTRSMDVTIRSASEWCPGCFFYFSSYEITNADRAVFADFVNFFLRFLALSHPSRFCRAMRCISAAYAVMRCLCVCHVRELCQNDKRYLREIFSPSAATPF